MPTLRTRRWLLWSGFVLGLIGVGVALEAWLPPEPRFVLRGAHAPSMLSTDGRILAAGVMDAPDHCASLKTWDTFTGAERHEFFRGLTSSHEVSIVGGIVGGRAKRLEAATCGPEEQTQEIQEQILGELEALRRVRAGLLLQHLVYSPDRRFCACLHHGGLALADLNTGQEWTRIVKAKYEQHIPNSTGGPIFRILQKPIDTRALRTPLKLKAALEYLTGACGDSVPMLVDREAFRDELGAAVDPYEEEVSLPTAPRQMLAHAALRQILAQVGAGKAGWLLRREFVEITTSAYLPEQEVWLPVFSPGSAYLALLERRQKQSTLHVVDCGAGQLLASLIVHPDSFETFGFTQDDGALYFFADEKGKPLLSVWSMREKRVVRTIPAVGLAGGDAPTYLLAPDGKTLLANTALLEGGGVDLVDLHTGACRRLLDFHGDAAALKSETAQTSLFTFTPDGATLVRLTRLELQIFDVAKGARRAAANLGGATGWKVLVVSSDGRVAIAKDGLGTLTAWHLDGGAQLWQRELPKGVADLFPRFTRDRRFVVEWRDDSICLLDPMSAEVRTRMTPGPHFRTIAAGWTLEVSADGRRFLTRWTERNDELPFMERWLGEWWPFPRQSGCLLVTTDTGRELLLLEGFWDIDPQLSPDGGTVLVGRSGATEDVLVCFDVPRRPSRRLVFGIPAAVTCVVLAGAWWFGRKKKPQTAA